MYGGAAVGTAAREAAKTYIKTAVQRRMLSGSPLTTQHDQSLRYRRKKMPRGKKRRWVRFTKRVKHVMLQMNSLTTWTKAFYQRLTGAANLQAMASYMLGGVQTGNNDELLQIFRAAYGSSIVNSNVDGYKLYLKAMCLDVQMTNTGSYGAIIDCYELQCRCAYGTSDDVVTAYQALYNLQGTTTGVGSRSYGSPASTPFENGPFLKYWKIVKKREILLGVGQVTTMQMRLPQDRILNGSQIAKNPQGIPGITRAYLYQVRGVPYNNAGSSNLAPVDITWAAQVTVTYGIPPGSSQAKVSDN